jgi:hypothetical protein
MSRDNKPKAYRHGAEAQSNSRALPGASTGLEVVCARRVMLAIQELAIRVGRNRTAKLYRVPAIPQRLGTPRPFDPPTQLTGARYAPRRWPRRPQWQPSTSEPPRPTHGFIGSTGGSLRQFGSRGVRQGWIERGDSLWAAKGGRDNAALRVGPGEGGWPGVAPVASGLRVPPLSAALCNAVSQI